VPEFTHPITARCAGAPESVEAAYREAVRESEHRKAIGKIDAIPVLRDRLRELEPRPGKMESVRLAPELHALEVRRQSSAHYGCPGCQLQSYFDVATL
jgi:hypothetical protein